MDILFFLRKLHGRYYRIRKNYLQRKQERRWATDAEKLRLLAKPTRQIPIDLDSSFLILMPHSDDEWIGCSQIIKRGRKVAICNMNMRGGDTDQMHSLRLKEAQRVANDYSREFITLPSKNRDEELADIINKCKPNYILLPYFFDWHPEHNDVMKICYRSIIICGYKENFLLYQVSVPIPYNDCNCCISMSEQEINEKWNLFYQYYKTQSFMPALRFKAYERINGVMIDSYAAETYCHNGAKEWMLGVKKLLLDNHEKDFLRTNLNTVSLMTEKVNRLYRNKQYTLNE